MSLNADALQYIVESTAARTFLIDGVQWTDKHMTPVLAPRPAPVEVSTLSAMVTIVTSGFGFASAEGVVAHVESPFKVSLIQKQTDPAGRRTAFAVAKAPDCERFPVGNFLTPDVFVVRLLTCFQQSGEQQELARLVSNIVAEQVATSVDDGVSQTVATRSGVSLKGGQDLRPFWDLRPYGSFTEIYPPGKRFALRARGGSEDTLPTLALFAADGGAWEREACSDIAQWFVQHEIVAIG